MLLPAANHLDHLIEYDDDSIQGELVCECGCREFIILHTGRQTRGLFRSELVKRDGQIRIKARCAACSKEYPLYCPAMENANARDFEGPGFEEFSPPNLRTNKWRLSLHYDWDEKLGKREGRWHSDFFQMCIDVWNDEKPKKRRIFAD